MKINPNSMSRSLPRQGGFSLVELMVAATLGLLLLAIIGNVYLAGRQSFRDQDESSRLQETGRFVADIISRVMHETGRTDIGPENTLLPFYALAQVAAGNVALDATDGAGTLPDTITMRFVSASPNERDCLGANINGTPAAPILVTQTLALNGTDLRCTSVIGGAAAQTGPLASDVEDLQILMGVDNNNDNSIDQYLPPTTANAAVSRAVSICVLVRTANGMAPAPQQYVNCNGVVVNAAAGDLRIRRAFTKIIGLRNRLG